MNLAQRGFLWILTVVALVSGAALALAGVQVARLHQDAASERMNIIVSELVRRLDGQAASAQTLGIVADGAIPRLLPDMTAAVIDAGGLIVALSANSGRWDGDPAPAQWLDPNGVIRIENRSGAAGVNGGGDLPAPTGAAPEPGTAALAGGAVTNDRAVTGGAFTQATVVGGDALIAGAPLHDRGGHLIGAVVVEDSGTAIPTIIGTLMPALLWGNLLLAASLPACWFGVRLAVTPLVTRAMAATALLEELGRNKSAGPVDQGASGPGDDLAVFGRAGRILLGEFDAAVEAVSISGDGGVELGVVS